MVFSKEDAFNALASLNPAPIFLESYRRDRLPEHLDTHFRPPYELFLTEGIDQREYTDGRLVPILSNGSWGIILLDPETRTLVIRDLESPNEVLREFKSWQQYLGNLMIGVAEALDDDEQRIRRIATLVGFGHVEQLLDFMRHPVHRTYDEHERAKQEFLSGL